MCHQRVKCVVQANLRSWVGNPSHANLHPHWPPMARIAHACLSVGVSIDDSLYTPFWQNVSFSIQPGQVTALVGPSGSGKSSCVSLLENFYTPQNGQVLLDGRPIETYQHGYLHSKVGSCQKEQKFQKP